MPRDKETLGTFYGIGVGPGDPELLTVKAIRAIEKADIIIAPKTEKKEGSVALTIAKPYLQKNVEIVYQVFPMVKNFSEDTDAWQENAAEIDGFLHDAKNVAFLTLGDPMFYSTYIYVHRLLKERGAKIVTVPGIPAFAAIGDLLGRSVAEGNEILTIIPATAPQEKITAALSAADNAVLMKVYRNFAQVADMLEANAFLDDAVLVSRCGLDDEQKITDIRAHKNEKLNYLSTILARKRR